MHSTRWLITRAALDQYADLARAKPGKQTHTELAEICGRANLVREQENGLRLFRGPRPLRVRLLVSPDDRLVQVLPQSPRVKSQRRSNGE